MKSIVAFLTVCITCAGDIASAQNFSSLIDSVAAQRATESAATVIVYHESIDGTIPPATSIDTFRNIIIFDKVILFFEKSKRLYAQQFYSGYFPESNHYATTKGYCTLVSEPFILQNDSLINWTNKNMPGIAESILLPFIYSSTVNQRKVYQWASTLHRKTVAVTILHNGNKLKKEIRLGDCEKSLYAGKDQPAMVNLNYQHNTHTTVYTLYKRLAAITAALETQVSLKIYTGQ